jgi:hypothetical protein
VEFCIAKLQKQGPAPRPLVPAASGSATPLSRGQGPPQRPPSLIASVSLSRACRSAGRVARCSGRGRPPRNDGPLLIIHSSRQRICSGRAGPRRSYVRSGP